MTRANVEHFLDAMIKDGVRASKAGLMFHLEAAFDGIEFEGKSLLDIGGGNGLHSFYAACSGAEEVVCLEPEARGGTPGAGKRFQELNRLLKYDCSRYNFFAFLRIRNPFYPTIEWHKHQAPEVWAELLGEVGFVNPETTWLSSAKLRRVGKVLLGNRFMAYFLTSHFRLTMEKP